jgi:hypothetical protein
MSNWVFAYLLCDSGCTCQLVRPVEKALVTMALMVPPGAYHGLRLLAELDDPTVETLATALAKTPPAGNSSKLADSVASQVASARQSDIRSIVRSLVNLHLGRGLYDVDASFFSEEICERLEETEEFQSIADKIETILRPRIERFLNMWSPLGITAKATEILMASERVYYDAKVITDMRAVFGEDVSAQPSGAVIPHLLAIHHHVGGQHRETFFALDDNDIEQLIEVLERARSKAETLRASLENAGIPHLGVD